MRDLELQYRQVDLPCIFTYYPGVTAWSVLHACGWR